MRSGLLLPRPTNDPSDPKTAPAPVAPSTKPSPRSPARTTYLHRRLLTNHTGPPIARIVLDPQGDPSFVSAAAGTPNVAKIIHHPIALGLRPLEVSTAAARLAVAVEVAALDAALEPTLPTGIRVAVTNDLATIASARSAVCASARVALAITAVAASADIPATWARRKRAGRYSEEPASHGRANRPAAAAPQELAPRDALRRSLDSSLLLIQR